MIVWYGVPMTNVPVEIPITNFHQVTDWLYRGAQPRGNAFDKLQEMQIKTVVTLRWRKGPIARERAVVEKLGIKFYSLRLNYWTLPRKVDVERFLDIVDDPTNHPVFVHCYHGADRTGVLIAMFRILRCHWTLEEAYVEMVKCGFHRFTTFHFKFGLFRLAKKLMIAEKKLIPAESNPQTGSDDSRST